VSIEGPPGNPRARRGGFTRRAAVASALGAGVGAASLPGVTGARKGPASGKRRVRKTDVVVVGAGLCGLSAARELTRRGHSCVVLEARKRVGGRVLNGTLVGGKPIELGGQWLGPFEIRARALAAELGLEFFDTYNSGENVYRSNGTLLRYDSHTPLGNVPPDPRLAEMGKAIVQIDSMLADVPADAPWESPHAAEWDTITLAGWLEDNIKAEHARYVFDFTTELIRSAHPRDVSLLSFLSYVRGMANEDEPDSATFERLITVQGGAQQSRLVGGTQLIATRAAKQLDNVVLNSPVRRVVSKGSRVYVHTDRVLYRAKRVIVAMSPAMSGQIFFDPPLPYHRYQLVQRFPQGSVIKVQCVYPKPFWRDEGLTGIAVGDSEPLHVTVDNSPPDGSPGVLVSFIAGTRARAWGTKPAAERQRDVVRCLVDYFGPEAAAPIQYIEMNWMAEQWTRGCYSGFSAPGVLLDYGPALRQPSGRIHWGGSETSDYSWGGMDGAVRAGHRLAAEVAPLL
jgi:monoamine oxidase